jgi:acyl carrier protein
MRDKLCRYIEQQMREHGDEVTVGYHDDLVELGLDSIGFLRLVDFIENEMGIRIPPADVTIDRFVSVESIVIYLDTEVSS